MAGTYREFDIIIVGGGIVGGALAYTLSKGPWQIALVDAVEKKIEDARLIALNAGSCCLFKNSGLWPALAADATSIQQIHVSHQGHFGITRIAAQELGVDTLGHVVPANAIVKSIFAALSNRENVKIICPALLTAITPDTETSTLAFDTAAGKEIYQADIIIGADGSYSTVRELLGIQTQTIDYQQSALVTVTELARHHNHVAYERFQKEGAIAMLPLADNRVATIWTSSNTHINHLMQLTPSDFLQQLQQQFGYRLGRMLQIGKRATYPLQMQQVQQQLKQNVLLIGNAAHTLHPIAAQGLNIALYEVAALTDYLLKQSSLKKCLMNLPLDSLQQSFSRRLSHGLTELFAKDLFPVNLARQAGMISFDQCTPLKKKFASHTMGKAGHVPSLFLNME